ncbi:MAG: hypothetical protein ABFC78_00530 [Methanoregula sp.]
MCDKQSMHDVPAVPGEVEPKEYESRAYFQTLTSHCVVNQCDLILLKTSKHIALSFRTAVFPVGLGGASVCTVENQVLLTKYQAEELYKKLTEALLELDELDDPELGFA